MNALAILILAGLIIFAIFILRQARRFFAGLLALAGLGVVGVVAYAWSAQAAATRQVAQVAQVQAMTNAATTLTLFLVILILLLVLAIIGAIAVLQWWQKRQKQQRLAEIVEVLQIQALLNGGRMPTGIPGQAPSTPIIVIPQIPQAPWVMPSGHIVMSLPEDLGDQPGDGSLFPWR